MTPDEARQDLKYRLNCIGVSFDRLTAKTKQFQWGNKPPRTALILTVHVTQRWTKPQYTAWWDMLQEHNRPYIVELNARVVSG